MNICVFGAASEKIGEIYTSSAQKLGEAMAKSGHTLVFGAGGGGVMGWVARGVKRYGGRVIGVVPSFFPDGVLYDRCDEIIKTVNLHDRKEKMEELSSAFIVAPGGVGTFDELFEVLTLRNLERHNKPIVLWNPNNYYDDLLNFLRRSVSEGFIRPECINMFTETADPVKAVEYINAAVR